VSILNALIASGMVIQKVFVFVKRNASSTQKIIQSLPTQGEIQGRQMRAAQKQRLSQL